MVQQKRGPYENTTAPQSPQLICVWSYFENRLVTAPAAVYVYRTASGCAAAPVTWRCRLWRGCGRMQREGGRKGWTVGSRSPHWGDFLHLEQIKLSRNLARIILIPSVFRPREVFTESLSSNVYTSDFKQDSRVQERTGNEQPPGSVTACCQIL